MTVSEARAILGPAYDNVSDGKIEEMIVNLGAIADGLIHMVQESQS